MSIQDDLRLAAALRDWPKQEPHRHVVHPAALERGGIARCADCFAVFDLGAGVPGLPKGSEE